MSEYAADLAAFGREVEKDLGGFRRSLDQDLTIAGRWLSEDLTALREALTSGTGPGTVSDPFGLRAEARESRSRTRRRVQARTSALEMTP